MSKEEDVLIDRAGLADKIKKSRLPARLDLLQSLSGLLLFLFMCGHMFFVATILLGRDAMWAVTKFFEGYFFTGGKSYPWIVSIVVGIVAVLFVVHAMLAVRKFPASYKQYHTYRVHMQGMHHGDTTLWIWQVYTGFALFFLASAHLYQMFFWPENIGPYGSGARMWTDMLWPFYLIMLLAIELHGGIGIYRLAIKWCIPNAPRATLRKVKWGLTAFFLIIGLLTLVVYMKSGYDHRENPNERYTPSWAVDSVNEGSK